MAMIMTALTIPAAAIAAEDNGPQQENSVYDSPALTDEHSADEYAVDEHAVDEYAEAAATNGVCGENLTWSYSGYTLTISGTGPMYDFQDSAPPWSKFSALFPGDIKKVIISDGVTSIGHNAFDNCSLLTSITIPNSVTSIGSRAFLACDSLTSITIPDGMTSIGDGAFWACSSLKSINIPDSVTLIGELAFTYAALSRINVADNNPNYTSKDGVLFTKDMSTLVCYPPKKMTSDSYNIPTGVTSIGDHAFMKCDSLTSITIPDSMTSIGYEAFYRCSSLANINIPSSVTSISNSAFYCCYSLTNITIPSSVTSIGNSAFQSCISLKSVTIFNSEVSLLGNAVFNDCPSDIVIRGVKGSTVEEYTYANNITFNALGYISLELIDNDDSDSLTDFRIAAALNGFSAPDSVNIALSLPKGAQVNASTPTAGAEGLLTVEDDGSVSYLLTLPETPVSDGVIAEFDIKLESMLVKLFEAELLDGTYVMSGEETLSISDGSLMPASLTLPVGLESGTGGTTGGFSWDFTGDTLYLNGTGELPDYEEGGAPWFYGASQIKHIVFMNNAVTAIGKNAFFGLHNVIDANMPSGLLAVGEGAFNGCKSLQSVDFTENMSEGIGARAFKNCSSLTEIYVPERVSVIGEGAFEGCAGLTAITLPFVGSQVGSLNNTDTFNYIFGGAAPENLTTVTITNEVSLPQSAFEGCGHIKEINLLTDMQDIGEAAFKDCESLEKFDIDNGITTIRDYTFQNCASITSITVPDTVQNIGESAFDGCKSLQSVHIPDGITIIRNRTFKDCASITSIEIPESVTAIGEETLKGCIRLRTMVIPFVGSSYNPGMSGINYEGVFGYFFGKSTSETATKQGSDSYEIPPAVTKVEVLNTDPSSYIPPGAFINCSGIADILIDGGAKVYAEAFKNCRNLKNLYIPKSIDEIKSDILYGCTSLETLTVPFTGSDRNDLNTETSVLGYFFGYGPETNVTDVKQQYSSNSNDTHFYYIPRSLKNVSVLNKTNISYGTFMNCRYLESISIVRGAVIDEKAFNNCSALVNVSLPSDLTEIGYEAFAECANLKTINLPFTNTSLEIGDYAFYNCLNLEEIRVPSNVTRIADKAFIGSNIFRTRAADAAEAAADAPIFYCQSGSYAEEYAIQNNINYETISADELNVKTTSTTVSALSDGSCLFDIIDTSGLGRGVLFAALYDSEDNLLKTETRTVKTNDAVETRIEMPKSEWYDSGAAYAKIFLWDSVDEMTPLSTTVEQIEMSQVRQEYESMPVPETPDI